MKALRIFGTILVCLLVACLVYLYLWSLVFGARFDDLSAAAEARSRQPHYIIDADTANEVDDLFAIVGALARDNRYHYDRPLLVGLTAAQFHTSPLAGSTTALESQRINEQLLKLMYATVPSFPGSDQPLRSATEAQPSPASQFIVAEARKASPEQKLTVFILGSCTNLASAILSDSSIVPNVHARYLGFWYDPATGVYDKKEFNTGNDPAALNLLLNTKGLEFTVMTATSSQALQMTREQLDNKLPADSPVTQYLQKRWDTYDRWWTEADPGKKQWTMWDVASLEAWFNPQLATLENRPAPAENLPRDINVYTAIDSGQMLEQWFMVVDSSLRATAKAIQ